MAWWWTTPDGAERMQGEIDRLVADLQDKARVIATSVDEAAALKAKLVQARDEVAGLAREVAALKADAIPKRSHHAKHSGHAR